MSQSTKIPVHNNTLSSSSLDGSGQGGGIFMKNCSDFLLSNLILQRNLVHSAMTEKPVTVYVPPPETTLSPACGHITITQSTGLFSEGSLGNYMPYTYCKWVLVNTDDAISRSFEVIRINVTVFDVELGYDFLYFYDGMKRFFFFEKEEMQARWRPRLLSEDTPALSKTISALTGRVRLSLRLAEEEGIWPLPSKLTST